jgi:hypothetical protein
MLIQLRSGLTLDLTIDEHLTVAPEVAEAHARYMAGERIALMSLILQAYWRDQPLCQTWAAACWTPHDLTWRPCCQTFVCDEHSSEHDSQCSEFAALQREAMR